MVNARYCSVMSKIAKTCQLRDFMEHMVRTIGLHIRREKKEDKYDRKKKVRGGCCNLVCLNCLNGTHTNIHEVFEVVRIKDNQGPYAGSATTKYSIDKYEKNL